MPTWQGRLPCKAFYPFFSRGTAVQAGLDEVKNACLARLSIPFSAGALPCRRD